jgi:hypothetical protein
VAILVVVGLVAITGAATGSSSSAPSPQTPPSGKRLAALPWFSWSAARGADHYEFQVAADRSFHSPVLGSDGHFTTRNTIATVSKTLPNGTYWWRVRAVTHGGGVSSWSTPRSFVKAWRDAPTLTAPASGSRVSYPTPLVLTWRPVSGAATYLVSIGSDQGLGSLIYGQAIETSALSLAPAVALHVGTYYWAVTPVDAEGNKGVRSKVRSFQWAWPSVPTNLAVRDLVSAAEVSDSAFPAGSDSSLFLPQFSWSAVPGATHYEVEINSDQTWAAGSRVCCTDKILASTFAPTKALRSNRYYWRVRAFDADGNAGAWAPSGNGTDANAFVKTFDNVCTGELPANCIPSPGPSIHNMHIEDWSGAVVTGQTTASPLVVWDPVPGASGYEYDVTRVNGGGCDFTWPGNDHWRGVTAVAAWSPLGKSPTVAKPYPDKLSVSSDAHGPVNNVHYCVRVRAQTERDAEGSPVYGDYTTLSDAFTYTSTPPAAVGSLGSGDYLTPAQGQSLRQMPYFRWRPVVGAKSYWVLVAKDPSFTNIVDYAFTQSPVYAPRTNQSTTTYSDETTTYYWVVLPARNLDGTLASGDPVGAAHGTFQKQVPPSNLQVGLSGSQPVFQWRPVAGARTYELEVSADPNFGKLVEKAVTPSTSYTAAVTYPPGKKLYWHVRADDEEKVGLSWATSSFQYKLGVPQLGGNDRAGDTIPTWRWKPVPGATSYDVHVDLPNGTHRDFNGYRTAAFTALKMTGTGIFHWQVRANFPNSSGATHGPYSQSAAFARTIRQPANAHSIGGSRSVVLSWSSVTAAKQYRVDISSKPDFSSAVERETTDNTAYAPDMSYGYSKGGTFFWRVSAVDPDGNTGDPSPTRTFHVRGGANAAKAGL